MSKFKEQLLLDASYVRVDDKHADRCVPGVADWQEEHAISLVLPSVRSGKFLLSLLLAPDYSHTESRRSAHLDSLLP